MPVVYHNEDYTPLAVRGDMDGKLWIKAHAQGNYISAQQPSVISGYSAGWMAQSVASCTATGAWAYIGIPHATVGTSAQAWFQIGGYASNVTFAASVSNSSGIGVVWQSVSIATLASSASSSVQMQDGVFGFMTADATSTTSHDLFLMGQMVQNVG